MRRTLHIVPIDIAPVVHAATKRQRTAPCRSALRKFGISDRLIQHASRVTLEALGNTVQTKEEIVSMLKPLDRVRISREVASWIIKLMWEEGHLSYQNGSPLWGREKRLFGSTAALYPSAQLNQYSEEVAVRELVRRHIASYGPVSLGDITWWSGLGAGRVTRAIQELGEEIEEVDVNGLGDGLWVDQHTLKALRQFDAPPCSWVSLLAYEDSSLKAYFTTRHRYVDKSSYHRLFNSIGEARASIVIDGVVRGTWLFNRKLARIEYQVFDKISKEQRRLLSQQVEALQNRLQN